MTLTQIEYFIEVAKCLNFSEAAKHLYITQPTLSRQITAIETELNMILFIRSSKSLHLTPSGVILFNELSNLMNEYAEIINRAEQASYGMAGTLKIGVLDGLDISDLLPDAIQYFEQRYPNIKLYLKCLTYSQLTQGLYQNNLDVIITFDFDIIHKSDLLFKNLKQCNPVVAIPKRNPLSDKESIKISDLNNEELVIVNEKECKDGVKLIISTCRQYGGFYPQFHYVDSQENAILWVEAGLKCAIFNTAMNITNSKSVKIFPLPELPATNLVISWNPNNFNFALNLFKDTLK